MAHDVRAERIFAQYPMDERRFAAVVVRVGRRWRCESNGYAFVAFPTEAEPAASESASFMSNVDRLLSPSGESTSRSIDPERAWLAEVAPPLSVPIDKACRKCHGEGVTPHDACSGEGCDACGDGFEWCPCATGVLRRGRTPVVTVEAFGRLLNGRALAAALDLFPPGSAPHVFAPWGLLLPVTIESRSALVTMMPIDNSPKLGKPATVVRMPEPR